MTTLIENGALPAAAVAVDAPSSRPVDGGAGTLVRDHGPAASAPQQPQWPDHATLMATRRRLARLPGVVSWSATAQLRQALESVATGRALVLQGGYCAETFEDSAEDVRDTLDLLSDMAHVMGAGAGIPVVRIGRLAGQYAKPRSSDVEHVGELMLPSFRGHIVHDHRQDLVARCPDPRRLLTAHRKSSATLRLANRWSLENGTHVWVSHEALLLDYEESLVRVDRDSGIRYGSSGHMLWLGERTRDPDGPHARLLESLGNPVAVKLGPTSTPEEVLQLCRTLDPARRPGRLTMISRMGARHVTRVLPGLIAAARKAGHPVVWLCDPMHGNTAVTDAGRKTRYLDAMTSEVLSFVDVARSENVFPGGLHLELTGERVEECVSVPGLTPGRSTTLCDPRLNRNQGSELARSWGNALLAR